MGDIFVGDLIRVSTTPGFKDAAGVLADPTAVHLEWGYATSASARAASVTTWVFGVDTQIVQESTGLYHADIPLARAGRLRYRWEGTGAVTAAAEGYVDVITEFP